MKKSCNKILAVVLTMAVLVGITPINILATDIIVASGDCGVSLTWTLDENGLLTISGTGEMKAWSSSSHIPWYSYINSIKSVVIENGVTTVGNIAFYGCESLESVEIGDSVTSIGDCAFSYCTNLTNVDIGDGVITIRGQAFFYCTSLTSVAIPNSVTRIGDDAFYGCESLASVEIGDSVTTIGKNAFWGCTSLISVVIPDSVTTIRDWTFGSCVSLTSAEIGDGVITIGKNAFGSCVSLTKINVSKANKYYCSESGILFNKDKTTLIQYPASKPDTSYSIPDSVITIGEDAFDKCTHLTNVDIGDGVITIEKSAFWGCAGLRSIEIQDAVTTIGDGAFFYCNKLTDVYYNGTQTEWDTMVTVGKHNDALLNATFHFKEPVPTLEVDNLVKGTDYITLDVSLTSPTELNGKVVVALYHKDCIVGFEVYDADKAKINATIASTQSDLLKVFWWEENTIIPVSECVNLIL